MIENILEFSEKPRFHAMIVFADESKSEPLYSKKEAFEKLSALAKDEEISSVEFNMMKNQIIQKKELPWDSDNKIVSIEIVCIGGGLPLRLPFGPLGPMFGMVSLLEAMLSTEKFHVEKPAFVPCGCGNKHGKIYTPEVETIFAESEKEGLELLQKMIEGNFIKKEEEAEVEEQIKKFFT